MNTSNHSRYFIGLVPEGLEDNSHLKQLLGKMKRTLREREVEARWAQPELWHVTLLFFGALSGEELRRATSALESWRPPSPQESHLQSPPLTIEIAGVGAFPDPHQARVLWLGIKRSQELLQFRHNLVEHIRAANIQGTAAEEEDSREFKPHLTLARLRNLQSIDDLVRLGGRGTIGNYPVREVVLFESVLQGNIKTYMPIVRRPIVDALG